jgi:clan AA aspartic protease (TIGR02281 family)
LKTTLLVAVGAFALGWWVGQAGLPWADVLDSGWTDAAPGEAPAVGLADRAAVSGSLASTGAGSADAAGGVSLRLAEYERLLRSGRAPEALRVRDELIGRIRAMAASGMVDDALVLLGELAAVDPYDGEFLLVESDLRQRQGKLVEALEPLLALLAQSDDVGTRERAREQLRRLVDVYEIQLANRRDYPGLVRFFEGLVASDPGWDEHRLRLARWLLQQGRIGEAETVAREIGGAGVSDAAREDLLAAIGVARDGLPVERSGRSLHVSATISGHPARLLVDTGATTTVLSAGLARALGSRARGGPVDVRTAAGVVKAELHEVADLRIGGLRLPRLEVVVLERVPEGADGLLGMDVLERLPQGTLPFSWLGRPPASG